MIGVNLVVCVPIGHPELRSATEAAVLSLNDSDLGDQEHLWAAVDNGSSDDTADWLDAILETQASRNWVYRARANLGIARARNIATHFLMAQGCDLILEVHNDMLFPRQWLGPLLETLEERPRCGLVAPGLVVGRPVLHAPMLSFAADADWQERRRLLEIFANSVRRPGLLRPGLQHPALKRTAMLRAIGIYDESFGLRNFEDTDEIYRMLETGWDYLVNLGSAVWHAYSFSVNKLGPQDPYAPQEAAFREKWDGKHEVYGTRLADEFARLYA